MKLKPLVAFLIAALTLAAGATVFFQNRRSPALLDIPTATEEHRNPVPGRWREFRPPPASADLTPSQKEAVERLESIGYLSGSQEPRSEETITVHDVDRAYAGYNVITSGHMPGAVLMDMEGKVLHTWKREILDIWPDFQPGTQFTSSEFWRTVHVFENGDILGIFEGVGIFKLDRDSNLIWENRNGAHHDLEVQENGDIYVLTRKARIIPWIHRTEPILEEFVCVLDAEGKERERVSLMECFKDSPEGVFLRGGDRSGDIFHTNTVVVLKGVRDTRVPWQAVGNILVSMRNINALVVVDPVEGQVVTAFAGAFKAQHDPTILHNGNILLFDNLGGPNGKSRIVEFDPSGSRLIWFYKGDRDYPLYSNTLGRVQWLPNSNILITESDNGRALEVTRGKKVVWEFYNPHRTGAKREYIATLFEVLRLPPDFPEFWAR